MNGMIYLKTGSLVLLILVITISIACMDAETVKGPGQGIVLHVEDAEKREHALNRIISIDEDDEGITISTTDVHLPHRIGRALKSAWGGSMSTHYDAEGCFARVRWNREGGR